MGRNSPHYRHYDKFRRSQISIAPTKTEYAYEWDDGYWMGQIALLNEYVQWDDGSEGRELCWVVHEEGVVCRRVEGHE